MNSVLYIHGQQEGQFNLSYSQTKALGLALKGYSNHEKIGCDDKIDSIQVNDFYVKILTTNGVEILSRIFDKKLFYTSNNIESGEEKTFDNYKEAYEYQFIEEKDVIGEKLETIISSLNDIKKELNK
jgi:hypothetical protein